MVHHQGSFSPDIENKSKTFRQDIFLLLLHRFRRINRFFSFLCSVRCSRRILHRWVLDSFRLVLAAPKLNSQQLHQCSSTAISNFSLFLRKPCRLYKAIQLGFASLQLGMMAFTRENPLINKSEEIPPSYCTSRSFISHTYRKRGDYKENEESKNLRCRKCYCLPDY